MPDIETSTTQQTSFDNPSMVPFSKHEDEVDKLFSFSDSRTHLKRLIDDWNTEVNDTEVRRKERKVEIDVEALRQKGDLDEDETIVPRRLIDTNIAREIPAYVNYLKNSRRICIFKSQTNPQQDTDLLEQEFTQCATYAGWEVPHYKCIDGSMAHGWDAIEVVFDSTKPGNFALEHVGHDKLFFPRSALDIQKSSRIIREYDVTLQQLRNWVEAYGFNPDQVALIANSKKDTNKEAETTKIQKLYFKKNGVVYIAWFCLTDGVDDWLKAPVPYYCGIDDERGQQQQMTLYPIFILPYRLSEEQKIVDCKGRGFLDGYKQEAETALWSAYINGMNRASNLYGSPKQEDGTGASLKELEDVKMTSGRFMSKPVEFWSPPYPDPLVLRTLQYSDNQNSDENNQVNFAAMNREDSRKTAREISAAQQQQVKIDSVQLTLFSTFIRLVYSFAWLITQSQARQNKIRFLLIPQQVPITNPISGQPQIGPDGQPQMQTVYVNDIATISQIYTVRAAGDVDVVMKQEQIQNMQTDMNLVMGTVLKDQFVADYIRLKYPERADTYLNILAQSGQFQQMKGLVGRLGTMLEGVLKDAPDVVRNLPQQQVSDLTQTIQEAKQVNGEAPAQ